MPGIHELLMAISGLKYGLLKTSTSLSFSGSFLKEPPTTRPVVTSMQQSYTAAIENCDAGYVMPNDDTDEGPEEELLRGPVNPLREHR